MKRLITTAILCGALACVYAQQTQTDSVKVTTTTTVVPDTATTKNATVKQQKSITVTIAGNHIPTRRDSLTHTKHRGFTFGLSLFPLDLGLANIIDNGSFTLSARNQFLGYSTFKTTNDAFNLIKFGYRFNNNFRITLGAGIEWTLIRLKNDSISIVGDKPALTYRNDGISYSKNRLSSEYLVVPLTFDYRSTYDKNGKRLHLSLAPQAGFLIDGMLKQISAEHGKTHNYNDFHFAKLEYGGVFRIGYGDWGIFTKYYFNDMFTNSPDQAGVKSFAFGLSYGW